jgi:hypothetical protein
MISVALVVFLILGVNQVFLYTSTAVGVGEAINTAVRDSRAVQATFSSDLGNMVSPGTGLTDSASLILSSYPVYAFNNASDEASSRTGDPSKLDLANTGVEGDSNVPGDIVLPCTYNYRNHRLDTLSFFSRDLFRRQTGNIGTYVDNMACQEAWVWYGHAWLPDNTGAFTTNTLPGNGTAATNPNNRFGSQFALARMAILLKEKSFDGTGAVINDPSGVSQRFFDRLLPYPTSTTPAVDLQPLSVSSTAAVVPADATVNPANNQAWTLQNSRYDLAATTINAFRSKFLSYISNTQLAQQPGNAWWQQMMTPVLPSAVNPTGTVTNRFQCNPYIPKPIDSAGAAQAAPYFLGGCSQFIVEYAGDYITQDNNIADTNYGYANSATASTPVPDGQIDYVLITQPSGPPRKQIRWYGLPRSTSGQSTINPYNGDVVTLNDWIKNVDGYATNPYINNPATGTGFEKVLPTYGTSTNYLTMQQGSQYLCAWGPNDVKPKLIRITITITDPAGRIPQGLTYQYVYPVP